MKKINSKKLLLSFIVLGLTFFILSQVDIKIKSDCILSKAAFAIGEAIKVFINGKEAQIVCEQYKETYLMPLTFPFKEGENKWEVNIKYNEKEKKVEVLKVHHPLEELLPTRGDENKLLCTSCSGTGKCQVCWPVGSGYSNWEGSPPCTWCNGSGKCWYCGGKGGW